jgi:hypothetical protein
MPKNPVRAAKQAGRQQLRAAKQTSKVAKIQNKTQAKLAKLQGSAPASATAPGPKFKTAAELKSTIKMPDMGASLNRLAKESSIKSGTGTKAPATSTKKSAPTKKSSPKPKAAAAPKAKMSPAVELAYAKKNYEEYRKKQQQGTYVTKPESRNMEQKSKVKVDNVKKINEELKAIQDKYKKPAPPKKKETPRMRVPGMTDWNNTVDKYSKKRLGGAMKSKKC